MSNKPLKFYRYRPFSADTLDLLCNDKLFFARPNSFNDPLDCSVSLYCDSRVDELRAIYKTIFMRRIKWEISQALRTAGLGDDKAHDLADRRARALLLKEINSMVYSAANPELEVSSVEAERHFLVDAITRELMRYYDCGVCCFSVSYSNSVMWSHYGDQHRGICIEYGINRLPEPNLKKAIYSKVKSIRTSILLGAFVECNEDSKRELDSEILLRKSSEWRYEREWRLIGDQGLRDSPLLFKSITFGLRCSESVKHVVVSALSERSKPVRFYEICDIPMRFSLRRKPLEFDGFRFMPYVASSVDEQFESDCRSSK